MNNLELYHHGVEGQKWGIQNGPPYPLDKAGKAAIRRQRREREAEIKSELMEKARRNREEEKYAKQFSDALSTKELEDLVRRLRLEKDLKSLMLPEGQKTVKKGDGFLKDIGKQAAKKVAITAATAAATIAVAKVLTAAASKSDPDSNLGLLARVFNKEVVNMVRIKDKD